MASISPVDLKKRLAPNQAQKTASKLFRFRIQALSIRQRSLNKNCVVAQREGNSVRLLSSYSREWKTVKAHVAPHELPPMMQDFCETYVENGQQKDLGACLELCSARRKRLHRIYTRCSWISYGRRPALRSRLPIRCSWFRFRLPRHSLAKRSPLAEQPLDNKCRCCPRTRDYQPCATSSS